MNFKLSKKDILRKKKKIDLLFSEGASISSFPLRFVYMKGDEKEASSLEVGGIARYNSMSKEEKRSVCLCLNCKLRMGLLMRRG